MYELIQRLERAATTLDRLYQPALHPSDPGMMRLRGKAEGVRLALSYVHEMQRLAAVSGTDRAEQ